MITKAPPAQQAGAMTIEQTHLSVDELLRHIDQESEYFRQKITALIAASVVHEEVSEQNDVRGRLISRLRETNQNLVHAAFDAQDLQARAETITQRQTEFLAMLAHELRNPMAPIAMVCEMLNTLTDAHPLLPQLHQTMNRQLNHMKQLIDELMDAARVSSGKIILNKRPLALTDIVTCAVEASQPFITRRRQQLELDLPLQPVFVEGDMTRLAQVLTNLLVNASKFTPALGHITVRAQRLDDTISVSVKDDGVGIQSESLPLVFELFVQGNGTLDRAQGGLGIGLSLARAIVNLHGGAITVASAGANLGSEFTVLLPIIEHQPVVTENVSSAAVPTRTCRILLIDDYPDVNETLAALLRVQGHTVKTATDGDTGLALANAQEFDVVVSDIGLPGMDGYEVARQLRQNDPTQQPCLIAVSGYDQPANRKLALEAGFDHYLVKPMAFDTLTDLIRNSLLR